MWCKGSGCIGAVAFGLYGSATLLWGMSTKARLTGIFMQFWQVGLLGTCQGELCLAPASSHEPVA